MICVVSKKCLDGEIQIIPYEDIVIICNKNRKHLKPNIYVNTKFLSIGETIRGNILIVCKENEKLKSLSKEQAIKYQKFLKNASFNYSNSNGNYKFIPKNNYLKNRGQLIIKKEIEDIDITKINNNLQINIETSEILKMILGIQAVILKFIKNNEE